MNHPIDKLHLFTLNVGLAHHNGDWNWKNVRSPFARLYLVVQGMAKIQLPTGTYDLTPGHLYFIPAFTTHSYVCDSLFTHYYIHIYEKPEEASILGEYDFPVEVEAGPHDMELMKRLAFINPFLKLPMSNPDSYDNHQCLIDGIRKNVQRPFCDKVESRGIIFILLSRFLKYATPRSGVSDSRIQQSLAYIRNNVRGHVSVAALASMACMSKDHYIRTFKKETGETPNAYITKRRMKAAELLLITTDAPVKAVADKLGYDDYSYFNKTFKRYSGVTPQQYRDSCVCTAAG